MIINMIYYFFCLLAEFHSSKKPKRRKKTSKQRRQTEPESNVMGRSRVEATGVGTTAIDAYS